MPLETIFLLICTFSFLVVSVALAGRFIVEAYLEYIQVREGIRVITAQQQQKMMEEMEDFDDDSRY